MLKNILLVFLLISSFQMSFGQRKGIIDADTTNKSATGLSIAYINKELVVNIDNGNLKAKFMRKDSLLNRLALKANLNSPTFTGTVVLPSRTSIGTVSNIELSYVDGVTSAIQTQLNTKLNSSTAGNFVETSILSEAVLIAVDKHLWKFN